MFVIPAIAGIQSCFVLGNSLDSRLRGNDNLNTMLISIVFGLLVGSFLNVCIFRLPRDESIVLPRSRCPSCRHVLSPAELVPVLSFLIQRGKCKSCGARISPRYAVVEILTAGVFALCHWLFFAGGDYPNGFAFLFFFCALIVVIFIDIDHMLILDVITYPGMAVCLIWSVFGHQPLSGADPLARVIESAQGLLLGGGTLWVIQFLGALWYRRQSLEAMGLGDVKLAAFTGAFLGPGGEIAALLYGVFIGGSVALILIFAGIKDRKDYIPFGPALALGAGLAPFFGDRLLAMYQL